MSFLPTDRLHQMVLDAVHDVGRAQVKRTAHCPNCGRPLPPREGGVEVERQACGRFAVPVPHVGLCFATDDRNGHVVRWSTRPVQTSLNAPRDETLARRG